MKQRYVYYKGANWISDPSLTLSYHYFIHKRTNTQSRVHNRHDEQGCCNARKADYHKSEIRRLIQINSKKQEKKQNE